MSHPRPALRAHHSWKRHRHLAHARACLAPALAARGGIPSRQRAHGLVGRHRRDFTLMKILSLRRLGARALTLLLIALASGSLLHAEESVPPLLLVSMDGFRWDYCALHPAETPHLRQLMREGVSARALIPVYPSNTFPNHYSIVTGLYRAHHGIINNEMFDPALQTFFHYNRPASAHDN